MPDKLTALRIKQQDGTYSAQIPVGALAENVAYNNDYDLKTILGNVDMTKGNLQSQIDTKVDPEYIEGQISEDVSNWLEENVDPTGSAVVVDSSLTIAGAAADAKATGDEITDLKSALTSFEDGYYDRNLFKYAELYAENAYVSITGGHITTTANDAFNVYIIPVNGAHWYSFTNIRFGLPLAADKYTATNASLLSNVTIINMASYANTVYFAFSFNKNTYPIDTFKCVEGRVPGISGVVLPGWSDSVDNRVRRIEANSGENLFSLCSLIRNDGYVYKIDDYMGTGSNANMSAYLLPVDGISTYDFTWIRFGVKLGDDLTTVIGNQIENATRVDSTGAKYIAFSFDHTVYNPDDYKIYGAGANVSKSKCDISSGSLADGGELTAGALSALKDGHTIVFKGTLSSFNTLQLGFINASSVVSNYIEVNSTKLIIKYGPDAAAEYNHGLSIANDISIIVEFKITETLLTSGNVFITIVSSGETYSQSVDWYQLNATITKPRIKSTGTVCPSAKLSVTYGAAERKIWLFGDSYIGIINNARWPYYLVENGYGKNALLSGSPGCTSWASANALSGLLKYGTPDIIVITTGMNDGSDGDTPPTLWTNQRDAIIALAGSSELVFCTIPTVPTVNNEKKNAWVRSSGYRYIDFASAVGASASGVWYTGMLSSDNVHPTEKGAKALYSQVLVDLPEVTIL